MLKGLFDFDGINEKTLKFSKHENLLYLSGMDRDENWLRVCNSRGKIGLVPINYVEINSHISGSTVIDFLDESLQIARRERHHTVNELQDIRRSILNPINDLEKRLKQFRKLMANLKSRNSPYQLSSTRSNKAGTRSGNRNDSDSDDDNANRHSAPASCVTCNEGGSRDGPMRSISLISSQKSVEKTARIARHAEAGCGDGPYDASMNLDLGRDRTTCMSIKNTVHDTRLASSQNSDYDDSRSCISAATYTCDTHPQRFQKPKNLSSSGSQSRILQKACITKSSSADLNSRIQIDSRLLDEMVDTVRNEAEISHESAKKAVSTVLRLLQTDSWDVGAKTQSLLDILQDEKNWKIKQSQRFLQSTEDFERLTTLLADLGRFATDEELWDTQGDEVISNLLSNLNTIISSADERITIEAISEEDFESLHSLAALYEKETRWDNRKVFLQCFTRLCNISKNFFSIIMNSNVPIKLAKELMDSPYPQTTERQLPIANFIALLLSNGDRMPTRHLDCLDGKFLHFLLECIETQVSNCSPYSSRTVAGTAVGNPTDTDLQNVFINIVLAYNLQFGSNDENITIQTLAMRRNAKVLTQRLVYFLLWDHDPLQFINQHYKQSNHTIDSATKMALEMLSSSMVADLFYTNDTKVLVDIILRALQDWEPGDQKRTHYLYMMRMIIRNTSYVEHNHRIDDVIKVFTAILLEEDPLALPDQKVIKEISNEFPELLK